MGTVRTSISFHLASTMLQKSLVLCRTIQIHKSATTALFSTSKEVKTKTKDEGMFNRFLGPNAGVEKSDTKVNRWSMLVPACITHACLGAPYGWSAVSSALSREQGVVASSASDWSLDLATYPMTIMIGGLGIGTALMGKWAAKVGPRRAMIQGCSIAGLGYLGAGAGIVQHNIYLLYGSIALIALGSGSIYTPPVQTMIDWFPDRKGLASGLVIGGFGSGALFFAPAMSYLMSKFSQVPTYIGQSVELMTEGGKQFANHCGQWEEVVYASASELAKLPYTGLSEGYYLVGTGSTGLGLAYTTIGLTYTALIFASALSLKRAPALYKPAGWSPPDASGDMSTLKNVHVDIVHKTPQFWLLFATSGLLCTGGMGLMAVAKPMITEVFSGAVPALVTTSFATAYLMAMAAGNLGGRVGWAAISDKIGRTKTCNMFTIGAASIYATLPWLIHSVITQPDSPLAPVLLTVFCLNTVLAITIMGGVFAVLPAYESDLYGPKHVGAIHSRFLLAATAASIAGPALLLNLRSSDEKDAITQLMSKIQPEAFISKFATDPSQLDQLVSAKTVTIPRLMEIAPTGTLDPSPFIYNSTLYTMAGLVSVAAMLHFMVKPVNSKYFEMSEKLKD